MVIMRIVMAIPPCITISIRRVVTNGRVMVMRRIVGMRIRSMGIISVMLMMLILVLELMFVHGCSWEGLVHATILCIYVLVFSFCT